MDGNYFLVSLLNNAFRVNYFNLFFYCCLLKPNKIAYISNCSPNYV